MLFPLFKLELPGIDPGSLYECPPVVCQTGQDIVIWQPTISTIAPGYPPGVSDPQSTSGLCATIVVLDLHLIIIAHGDDGMATHDPFILAGIGDLAGLCSLIDPNSS